VIPFASDEPLRAAARTDASGAFRIDHVPPGPHVVRATAPGFGAAWTTLAGGEPQSALELRLGVPGRLAGRVAHDDGRPWRGAIVIASFMRPTGELDRFSYGIAFAEADGSYAIADLPAGDYVLLNVSDNAPGSEATASRQVHVSAGRTTTANLPEAIDGPRFTGRVLDAGGQPLAGLDVTLQPRGADGPAKWRSQRSDAAGAFTFTGLPSAVYDVFVGESLGERFVWIEEITVPPGGALTHDVQVGAGRIRGRATSPHAAIGGSFVVLLRAERDQLVFAGRVRTDAEGVFEFERLVPATYRAIVYPEQKGLAPQASGDLWVARGGPLVECTLAVERGASLAVVVRDAQGVGLHGVALAFRDAAGQAFQFSQADVTGVDGRFAAYNLAAGRWTVTARTAGGATTTRDIELLVGDERELVLTLP
jgi:protocatechuate 3,4-dioxygenase beta subunit